MKGLGCLSSKTCSQQHAFWLYFHYLEGFIFFFPPAGSQIPLAAVAEGDGRRRSREGPNHQVCDTKITQLHPAICKLLWIVYGKAVSQYAARYKSSILCFYFSFLTS